MSIRKLALPLVAIATLVVSSVHVRAQPSVNESIKNIQNIQKSSKISNTLSGLTATSGTTRSSGLQNKQTSGDGMIAVDVLVSADVTEVAADLRALGMKSLAVSTTSISGYLPMTEILNLENHELIKAVRHHKIYTKNGAVTSEGVIATQSDKIADVYKYTGRGVKIGVISDSYNCNGGHQIDLVSGDVPRWVEVLSELEDCSNATDEGRALVQIIYDFAENAKIYFGTGFNPGLSGTAELIATMVETHNVDIIIDDIGSYESLFFQDDVLTMAVEQAVNKGVTYITSAGNAGKFSYEGVFTPTYDPILDITVHNFDNVEGTSAFQNITIPKGEGISLVMQWDEPAYSVSGGGGSRSDLDIFLLSADGSRVLAAAAQNNLGNDPIEVLEYFNHETDGESGFRLLIVHSQGRYPELVKYYIPTKFTGSIDSYSTESSTIIGHSNAEGAITVGASLYTRTEQFGHSTNEVEEFSSKGGTPILFDQNGIRFNESYRVRLKPDITAPNGVNTTFFEGEDLDSDGFPNFRGTSASAPHVAGIVALMLEANPKLTPQNVKQILQETASDITSSSVESLPDGFDFSSGYGLVHGYKAVQSAREWVPNEDGSTNSDDLYPPLDGIQAENEPVLDDLSFYKPVVTGAGTLSYLGVFALVFIIFRKRFSKSTHETPQTV